MAYPIMLPNSTWYKGSTLRTTLTEVHFMDSYTPTEAIVESWSADVDNTGAITCYVEGTVLTIVGNGSGKIALNSDSSKVFYYPGDFFSNVAIISGLNLLDTSNVTTLQAMFANCSSVISLDVGSWDTSKVTSLRQTFTGCSALTGLDVSNWDTRNVETMLGLFTKASSLTSLDLSNWDTSKVTSFKNMFAGGQGVIMSLTSIGDTSNWDTSSLTEMEGMFQRCQYLEELNASNWDVSKVTSMRSVFVGCSSLTSLDISKWVLSSCTTMTSMFSECSGLTTLDVSNWDTSSCTDMSGMFNHCSSLMSLDVREWDVSHVTNMKAMFQQQSFGAQSSPMTFLDVSKWDTSSCTDMGWMFYAMTQLQELDVSGWDVSNVVSMHHIFAWCQNVVIKGLENWNPHNCTTFNAMFHNDMKLESVNLSNWDTSKCENFGQMFEYTPKLKKIVGLETLNTSNGKQFYQMFYGCQAIKELDLSNFDTRGADDTWIDPYRGTAYPGIKEMFGLIQTQYGEDDPNRRYYGYMKNLRKITLGPNFSFSGNGSCEPVVLERSVSQFIPYADGYWYDEEGTKYEPSDIPNGEGTYYVANMNEDLLIKKGTLINIVEALREACGETKGYLLSEIPKDILDLSVSEVFSDIEGNVVLSKIATSSVLIS